MTTEQLLDAATRFNTELRGKTITGIKPVHINGDPVPTVHLFLSGGSTLLLSVKAGSFFESCMTNALRKAQPIDHVEATSDLAVGRHRLEVWCRTFPALSITAVNKDNHVDEWPFVMELSRG